MNLSTPTVQYTTYFESQLSVVTSTRDQQCGVALHNETKNCSPKFDIHF